MMMFGGILCLVVGVNALSVGNAKARNPKTQENVFTKNRSTIGKVFPTICDSVKQVRGRQFFYWHFDSRRAPSTDPLLVYVNGAFGSSSILGLNSGVFPCQVNGHGNDTLVNPFALNNAANLLFIDPVGVGFVPAAGQDGRLLPNDVAYVLQQFMRSHPEMRPMKVHLMGESYASGILLEAARVIHSTKFSAIKGITLASVIVGSAIIDAGVHYALLPGLASKLEINLDSPLVCIEAINACRLHEEKCIRAYNICQESLVHPYQDAGHSIYQAFGSAKPFSYLNSTNVIHRTEAFLNTNAAKEALGIPLNYAFRYNNLLLPGADFAIAETMKNYHVTINELSRNGIRVLVYAGDLDYLTNSLAISSILIQPRTSTLNSPMTGDMIGSLLVTKEATGVKFANATHHVQMDQPRFLHEVITRWLHDELK